jgi:cell pole-organizing protein PopZ
MSSPAKAHEPTMEEILASIRRIISDDEAGTAAPAGSAIGTPFDPAAGREDMPQSGAAEDGKGDDVLELTEPMSPAASREDPRPESSPSAPAPAMASPLSVRPPAAERPDESRLLSAAANSAVSSAFGALAHTIVAENARTLEDIVHEMLRPMLKAWLDDNLPALVERLVRQEIEHVSRGRR